jgi:CRP-like cAMP-binding protein
MGSPQSLRTGYSVRVGGRAERGPGEALRKVPLFSLCSEHELNLIASQMEERTLPKGETLTTQNAPAGTFYVIVEGEVEAVVDGASRGALGAGDFIGEISMLDGGPATATTTTAARSRLLAISHDQFREFVRANDWLLTRLLGVMALRQRRDYAAWRDTK